MINKKNKSLLIIIPARLDSTRLSKKLIRKISGVPMIIRVAESALKTKLGDVLVATDSKQIQNLCKNEKVDSVLEILGGQSEVMNLSIGDKLEITFN